MLIKGSIKSKKTEILAKKYAELINNGIPSEKILVICLNSYKKQKFIDYVLPLIKADVISKMKVFTFVGLAHNAVIDNWAFVQKNIKDGENTINPNLCGLELSQLFFRKAVKKVGFADYFSKISLVQQLFRRYALITFNDLSENEVNQRSEKLNETFADDAYSAINYYKKLSLKYRSFDYLRQLSLLYYINKNTDYFKEIEYLFIDDADEGTFALFNFAKSLEGQIKEYFIACDENGSSRMGYLGAFKQSFDNYSKLKNIKNIITFDDNSSEIEADKLLNSFIKKDKYISDRFSYELNQKRLEMLDSVVDKVRKLTENNIKFDDILIVTPNIDDMLKCTLERNFENNIFIMTGSEKLKDSSVLCHIFTVLKLVNPVLETKINPTEIRNLFDFLLKISRKKREILVKQYYENENIFDVDFENDKIKEFFEKLKELDFREQLYLVANFFIKYSISDKDIQKINFFIKEINSFYNAFKVIDKKLLKEIILQFENGIISENSTDEEVIPKGKIVVATPQRVIDFEIKRKYHFWLDLSDELWIMRDIGPIYNAWGFSAGILEYQNDIENNQKLSREKTARILRKLLLCNEKKIFCFASFYNSFGVENIGNLSEFFENNFEKTDKNEKEIPKLTPRKDQKPVLEYKKGNLAVNAVPGAGKTTVLVLLALNLIEQGANPENIYILTYMESAATTLRSRIKNYLKTGMPNISTIHGLALRILKENNNFLKVNLSDDFQICDDTERKKILADTMLYLNLKEENFDDFERAISACKMSEINPNDIKSKKKFLDFVKVYEKYQENLRANNFIDYDDILGLTLKLLSENKVIRDYYSDMCHFIIEDEAQDSSEIQQKILKLLSSKHNNLLRFGDINQAITSSFTEANPKNFREFFEKNNHIEMNISERNTKNIQDIANKLIDFSIKKENLKRTFFKTYMQTGKNNPQNKEKPIFLTFETDIEEKSYILSEIKKHINQGEKSIAILLRNNFQILEYSDYLRKNGILVTLKTDILENKNIYNVIDSFLQLYLYPNAKSSLIRLMQALKEANIFNFEESDFDYIAQLDTQFLNQNPDDLPSGSLKKLYFDLDYFVDLGKYNLSDLALDIGLMYFNSAIEKSNVFIIAEILKKLSLKHTNNTSLLEEFEFIAKKPLGNNFNLTEEEKTDDSIILMTVHKSKGDEFDVVFIPELSEENYPLQKEFLRSKNPLSVRIKEEMGKQKENYEIQQLEESLRLLYVAFTRGKKYLYLTCPNKVRKYKKYNVSGIYELFEEAQNENV